MGLQTYLYIKLDSYASFTHEPCVCEKFTFLISHANWYEWSEETLHQTWEHSFYEGDIFSLDVYLVSSESVLTFLLPTF